MPFASYYYEHVFIHCWCLLLQKFNSKLFCMVHCALCISLLAFYIESVYLAYTAIWLHRLIFSDFFCKQEPFKASIWLQILLHLVKGGKSFNIRRVHNNETLSAFMGMHNNVLVGSFCEQVERKVEGEEFCVKLLLYKQFIALAYACIHVQHMNINYYIIYIQLIRFDWNTLHYQINDEVNSCGNILLKCNPVQQLNASDWKFPNSNLSIYDYLENSWNIKWNKHEFSQQLCSSPNTCSGTQVKINSKECLHRKYLVEKVYTQNQGNMYQELDSF